MTAIKIGSWTYKKRRKTFENYNGKGSFNVDTFQAWSYHWWLFTTQIKDVVIVNDATYSNNTSKHQSAVRQIMYELKIKPTIHVSTRAGLQNLDGAIERHTEKINELKTLIATPGTWRSTNERRLNTIDRLNLEISVFKAMKRKDAKRLKELTRLNEKLI